MNDVSTLTRQYVTSRRKLGEFAPSTTVRVRYTLAAFSEHVGNRPIEKVTRQHIERWLERMPAANSTKRTRLGQLRAFFTWCVHRRLIDRNPADGIRGPKPAQGIPRALPADEISTIFNACPDRRAQLMVLLMVQEGLRACEVARIRREDLDLGGLLVTVMGKGSKERVVPLSTETTRILFDYLAETPGAGGALIRSHNDPTNGIQAEYISKLVSTWMKDAGVKKAPFDGRSGHALRHSCATHMADQGVDLRVIADVLGHVKLSTVEIYTRRAKANGPMRAALAGRSYLPAAVAIAATVA